MDISKNIIERFFRNEATPEEVEAVKSYFENNPEQLTKYEQELEQYTTEERLPRTLSESMFQNIESRIAHSRYRRMVRYSLAAAAAIMIVVGATWMFILPRKENQQLAEKVQPAQPRLVQLVNKSDTVMQIRLTDGSLVQLYQHSGISYYEPFIENRRDISLKGIGLFTVAKDKTKPFTVYAGGVGTTALGTQFKVNAASEHDSVIVQLYEGKVVVKQMNGNGTNYLLPGQQLVFNSRQQSMTVATMKEAGNGNIAAVNKRGAPISHQDQLIFKNQTFEDVVMLLENTYAADIIYNESNINPIKITGEFKPTDRLLDILNIICMPNGLHVVQKGNTYIIK